MNVKDMKELNPHNLNLAGAIDAMRPAAWTKEMIGSSVRPDPEREAFDKWWNQKSAEPLNYKDIKHYAWSAWIESAHRTMTIISEKVDSLKKGKV